MRRFHHTRPLGWVQTSYLDEVARFSLSGKPFSSCRVKAAHSVSIVRMETISSRTLSCVGFAVWDQVGRRRAVNRLEFSIGLSQEGSYFNLAMGGTSTGAPNISGCVRWFLETLGTLRDPPDGKRGNDVTLLYEMNKRTEEILTEIFEAEPIPGELCLQPEEVEVFQLLGNPPPILWNQEKFRAWTEEQGVQGVQGLELHPP